MKDELKEIQKGKKGGDKLKILAVLIKVVIDVNNWDGKYSCDVNECHAIPRC